MSAITIDVSGIPARAEGTLVVLADDKLNVAAEAGALLGAEAMAALGRAAKVERFKGKAGASMTMLAPLGTDLDRLVVMGCGSASERAKLKVVDLGGSIAGAVGKAGAATVIAELPWTEGFTAEDVADLSLGARLRHYSFDTYKTKKKDDEPPPVLKVALAVREPTPARRATRLREGLAKGVTLARDLVNEPPNVLFPEEFAKRAQGLTEVGVEVEVLGDKELRRIGMRALLGVGQGSARESRVVIMRWNGARSAKAKPVAFIGKGVCFDTGGISIKPAAGMEDMKGDMAGAATVVGLMHALAARKAKVNAIGVIGLVENMPDGNAQRPGDIVTSLSGQTIEIINTDAEGRLVLGDLLWHVKEQFKPRFMVNLATLTGAIIVALGQEHAGMFCNDDELAGQLSAAGLETSEKVWRMPLGPEYDKQIDSKFADMKNTGGRNGGAITAAQFLKRFVGDTPWAHLDIAGTAMGSPSTETNKGWSSGFGVRLLDRLVRDHYEG